MTLYDHMDPLNKQGQVVPRKSDGSLIRIHYCHGIGPHLYGY